MCHYVEAKTQKLRKGGYADFAENWLVIEDNLPVPIHDGDGREEAIALWAQRIEPLQGAPAFSNVFIGNSTNIVRVTSTVTTMLSVRNLWV